MPALPFPCHQHLSGSLSDPAALQFLADKVAGGPQADLTAFATRCVVVFSTGYNLAFGVAAVAMLASLAVYLGFWRMLPERRRGDGGAQAADMPREEERRRLVALGLVFLVVLFFWMSFHQNGLTRTYFARDYTVKEVERFTYNLFDIRGLLSLAAIIVGVVFVARRAASVAAAPGGRFRARRLSPQGSFLARLRRLGTRGHPPAPSREPRVARLGRGYRGPVGLHGSRGPRGTAVCHRTELTIASALTAGTAA